MKKILRDNVLHPYIGVSESFDVWKKTYSWEFAMI